MNDTSRVSITGTMPTERAERYAKQLLSHWAKRGTVTTDPDGTLQQVRDNGEVITLRPTPSALEVEVSVPAGQEIDGLSGAVKSHLERFGTREELELTWRD